MKYYCALVLMAAACASPEPRRIDSQIRSQGMEASYWDVDSNSDSETSRRLVTREEFFPDDEVPRGDYSDPDKPNPHPDPDNWAAHHVARVIRAMVAPESWRDPRRALYVEKDALVLRHSIPVMERAHQLMDVLKSHRNHMVAYTVRPLALPTSGQLPVDRMGKIQGGLAGVFDSKDLRSLDPRSFHLGDGRPGVPRSTLFVGQAGHFLIQETKVILEGYTLDGSAQIGVIKPGMTLQMRGIPNGRESKSVLIDLSLECRDFQGMRHLEVGVGKIQRPQLFVTQLAGRFVLAPDQALLLVPDPSSARQPWIEALILEVELIDLDE